MTSTGSKIIIDRIMQGDTQAFAQWDTLMRQIFPDTDDQESPEELQARLEKPDKNMFFLFRDGTTNEPIGIELLQRDTAIPDAPVAYVPWAGMIEGHRNHGEYPAIAVKVMDIAKKMGVACMIHEVEDPKRCHIAYDEEPGGENAQFAARRKNFWRREPLNTLVIDDGTSGDKNSLTAYVRPASSDPLAIQAYDIMAIRELNHHHLMFGTANPNDPDAKGIYNADKTAISLSAYKRLYLQMNQLQYDIDVSTSLNSKSYYTKLERRMRKELPAVEDFCARIDRAMKISPWIALENSPIVAKSTPAPEHQIVFGTHLETLNKPVAAAAPSTGPKPGL